MESKNIIIILIAVIAVLGLVLGIMFLQTTPAKEPTKVKITSNNTQYESGKISVKLTDLNKTALTKEKVTITIKNGKGKVVVNKTVKTDSKGNAKLDLDLKKGTYKVNVDYAGNDSHTGSNATQKLTIKQANTKSVSENRVDTSLYSSYSPKVGYYRIVETQQEIALIETPDGNNYVITGDGIRTYNGRDSQGHIEFGNTVG